MPDGQGLETAHPRYGNESRDVDPLGFQPVAGWLSHSLRRSFRCAQVLKTMKYAIWLLVFLWFLCGLIGAKMEDDLDFQHWKTIARGPITLVHAINDNPTTVPGLN